jgi:hypothetical protein
MTGSTFCSLCARGLQPHEILYTADARIVCASCNAKVDVVVAEARVGHNIRNASITALVLAGVSFFFNPFWIITIISTITAIGSLVSIGSKGDERFAQHADKGVVLACSIIALVIDGIILVLTMFAIAVIASS